MSKEELREFIFTFQANTENYDVDFLEETFGKGSLRFVEAIYNFTSSTICEALWDAYNRVFEGEEGE